MTSLLTQARTDAPEAASAPVPSQAAYETTHSQTGEWPATFQIISGNDFRIVTGEPPHSAGAARNPQWAEILAAEFFENVGGSVQADERRAVAKGRRSVNIEVSREARPLLAGELSRIQQILAPIIISKANECCMPLKKIYWSIKAHPDEKWRELVCSVFVEANCPQALAFWDALGQAISAWRKRETPLAQRLLNEQVAIFVEWE